METIAYKNLTELLLYVIRFRSAIFIKEAKIFNLSIFITGYYACNSNDLYFDESEGFLAWFCKKKNPAKMSRWEDYFLAMANYNEHRALDLYFEYLDEYHNNIAK
jgi:hypothetical protein